MRVAQPGLGAVIKVGGVMRKRYRSVRPSEMINIDLEGQVLEEVGAVGELVVDCETRGSG